MNVYLRVLLAFALISAQWAGHVHGLEHAGHELAEIRAALEGSADPAALDHGEERCLAFHALDSAAAPVITATAASLPPPPPASGCVAAQRPVEPLPYSSRAPPLIS